MCPSVGVADAVRVADAVMETNVEDELRLVEKKILRLMKDGKPIPFDLDVMKLRLLEMTADPDKKAAISIQLARLLELKQNESSKIGIHDVPSDVLKKVAEMKASGKVPLSSKME